MELIEPNTIAAFMLASALLGVAPGPDNIFVLTQSAMHGKKAGVVVTLGLCTGLVLHSISVALGVAAVFQTSQLAFDVLRYAGAAYLVYLAFQIVFAKKKAIKGDTRDELNYWSLYRRGFIMNIVNPKISIFFLAFLPQFTNPDAGRVPLQVLLLGLSFIVVTMIVFSLIATFAGAIGERLNRSERAQLMINSVAAIVFVALAANLVLSRN